MGKLETIERAAPFGMGNPAPHFALRDVRVIKSEILKAQHIRLLITDARRADAPRLWAMAFRAIDTPLEAALIKLSDRAMLAGQVKLNRFNGNESVQFIIEDVMAP